MIGVGENSVLFRKGDIVYPDSGEFYDNAVTIKTQYGFCITASPLLEIMRLEGDMVVYRPLSKIRVGDCVLLQRGIEIYEDTAVLEFVKRRIAERILFYDNKNPHIRITARGLDALTIQVVLLANRVVSFAAGQVDKQTDNIFHTRYVSITGEDVKTLAKSGLLGEKDKRKALALSKKLKPSRAKRIYPPMNEELRRMMTDILVANYMQKSDKAKWREFEDYFKDKNLTRIDKFLEKFNEYVQQYDVADRLRAIRDSIDKYIFVEVKEVIGQKETLYPVSNEIVNINGFSVNTEGKEMCHISEL